MKPDALRISRVLHAGYIFETPDARVLFDPIFENPFSRNCYAFPDVTFDLSAIADQNWSAVVISHYHDDHFSLESLRLIDRKTPIYMYAVFEELRDLIRELGFSHVYSLEINKPVVFGSLSLTPLRALDEDVDCLFRIETANVKVLNVVDSWIAPSTFDRLQDAWDLVLWPFQTLRELAALAPSVAEKADRSVPPEWLEQLKLLRPKVVVPSSCQFRFEEKSWLNQIFFPISYESFTQEVLAALPESQVLRIEPGATYDLSREGLIEARPLEWVQSARPADYTFNEATLPTSTREIARWFDSLTPSQTEFVFKWCEHTLPARFSELPLTDESFFDEARVWRLEISDSAGGVHSFKYRLDAQAITPLSRDGLDEPHDWLTEIPIARLWGALKEGESLTSLYARVTPPPDADPPVHPLADPLLRCLYDGVVGGYQRAQLTRITSRTY